MSKPNPHAAALGRKGGAVKSDAKRAAARKNLKIARKTRWVDRKRLVS
jgi:hypothetical protein